MRKWKEEDHREEREREVKVVQCQREPKGKVRQGVTQVAGPAGEQVGSPQPTRVTLLTVASPAGEEVTHPNLPVAHLPDGW
jgi:hypothetical protein